MGYEYYLLIFAEKDLRVDNIAQDAELLNYPERFFLAIRTAEATDSDQRYDMRRERDQTEAAERSRLQMLELVSPQVGKTQMPTLKQGSKALKMQLHHKFIAES